MGAPPQVTLMSSSAAIEKGKGVVEVLSQLGSTFGKDAPIEGGVALGSLFAEMSRTFKLFEMFYANFVRSAICFTAAD